MNGIAPKPLWSVGFLAGLSLLCVGGYFGLARMPWLSAQKVTVSGALRLSPEEIRRRAGLRTGQNILAMNLALAEKRLRSEPWVAEARVERTFPPGFRVRVREHEPLARFDVGTGYLVDAQGRVFKRRGADDPLEIPVVSGLRISDLPRPDEASHAFQAVMNVLQIGRRPDAVLPIEMIERIGVDPELGITLTVAPDDRLAGAREIRLGFDDFPAKFDRLRTFSRFVLEDGHMRLQSIDLNIPDRVVVEPDPAGASVGDEKEV
ncbi:MAG: cell division protein FtsQ/DivIB [Desulfococcaceae bacterium]